MGNVRRETRDEIVISMTVLINLSIVHGIDKFGICHYDDIIWIGHESDNDVLLFSVRDIIRLIVEASNNEIDVYDILATFRIVGSGIAYEFSGDMSEIEEYDRRGGRLSLTTRRTQMTIRH